MKNTIITTITILLSIFFVWGAVYVNLPAKNYFWVAYDLLMAGVVWYLKYVITNLTNKR